MRSTANHTSGARLLAFLAGLGVMPLTACPSKPKEAAPVPSASASTSAAVTASAPTPAPSASAVPPPPRTQAPPDSRRYAWLADEQGPKANDTLIARFDAPPGYRRVTLDPKSFGHFLRYLPLAPSSTPVADYAGKEVHPADHEYIAAVAALDVGKKDLQGSPDAVVRLHAEWAWSLGIEEVEYRAVTDLKLDSKRYFGGQDVRPMGALVGWVPVSPPRDRTHDNFRSYLDIVFLWTNTNSLAKQSTAVESSDVSPGDFFVHTGKKGDALLLLDIAEKVDPAAPGGRRRVALLGQALSPASSFMVLRLGKKTPWFSLRPDSSLITAFVEAYQWESLHRLPPPPGLDAAGPPPGFGASGSAAPAPSAAAAASAPSAAPSASPAPSTKSGAGPEPSGSSK